jgi:crossover junction endodeoxyribonuclease RusA
MKIVLPWPDKVLSPNARAHYRVVVPVKAAARENAAKATWAAAPVDVRRAVASGVGRIELTVRFYPPDKRHRDDDNMIGSFKAARDGIADGLKVNDRRFRAQYVIGEAEKPGRIEVVISSPQRAHSPNADWIAPKSSGFAVKKLGRDCGEEAVSSITGSPQ